METVDERVAYLEGKVEEQSRGFADVRESVRQFDAKLDRLIAAVAPSVPRMDGRGRAVRLTDADACPLER